LECVGEGYVVVDWVFEEEEEGGGAGLFLSGWFWGEEGCDFGGGLGVGGLVLGLGWGLEVEESWSDCDELFFFSFSLAIVSLCPFFFSSFFFFIWDRVCDREAREGVRRIGGGESKRTTAMACACSVHPLPMCVRSSSVMMGHYKRTP